MDRQGSGGILMGRKSRIVLGEIAARLERVLEEDELLLEKIYNIYRDAAEQNWRPNLSAVGFEKFGMLMGIVAVHSGQETMRHVLTGQTACLAVPESAAVFFDACIRMHPAAYPHLYRFICGLCAHIENPPDTATYRAKMMISMRIPAHSRERVLAKELPSAFAICRLHNRRKLSLEEVPRLANVLDVSPHWLWMLDENAGIYCDDGRVDCLVDAFLLLDTDMRERVAQVACAVAETGGEADA